MEKLIIRGGKPLYGAVEIHGAKNSILPILAAGVLCPDRCVIARCPDILDVSAALEILTHLGCRAEIVGTAVVMDAADAQKTEIPPRLMSKMRASVNFLGALLGRFGRGELSLPGGCSLGARPIDYHINALRSLGVTLEEAGDTLQFSWPKRHGGEVTLPFPSVGATENVVTAAVTIPEPVVLKNAAREPEVQDLCGFLTAMGAEISGAGTDTIYIRGGKPLSGAVYTVLPDRIETATYLAMAAACGGRVTAKNAKAEYLQPVLDVLNKAGCRIGISSKDICLTAENPLRSVGTVETAAYPGFPTDAQAPVMAALLRAQGESVFLETVFCSRFQHVAQLKKFGAEIEVQGCMARVRGVEALDGARVRATDLRGGAGLLTAALQANGVSVIENTELVRRGYARLAENLRNLGAEIQTEA